MIIRLGLSGWSVWIVYVLVGTMQLVLIVTAVVYMIRDRRKARRADQGATATPATDANPGRDVSQSPSVRAIRPALEHWNSFAAAPAGEGNERTPLLAGRNKHIEEGPSPRRVA